MFVGRPEVAVIIVGGGGGSLIECHNSFLRQGVAKGQVFCFVVLLLLFFLYHNELQPFKWVHICSTHSNLGNFEL